jgi:hypothetical protein
VTGKPGELHITDDARFANLPIEHLNTESRAKTLHTHREQPAALSCLNPREISPANKCR